MPFVEPERSWPCHR